MIKHLLILFFLFFSSVLIAQSSFKRLSRPEKCWVLCHPFKAKKAQAITKRVQFTVDSLKKNGTIGIDENGGKLDAFRHSYWMASLSQGIGKKQALGLGKAHEKGNYLQYKKRLLEDSILPDSASSEMDLRNNEAGVNCFAKCPQKITEKELADAILRTLKNGNLFIIKKNSSGNYVDCNGIEIDLKKWQGKWDIPKCLIPSKEQ